MLRVELDDRYFDAQELMWIPPPAAINHKKCLTLTLTLASNLAVILQAVQEIWGPDVFHM